SAALKERTLAAARRRVVPVREQRARRTLLLVGVSWLVAIGVFVWAGGPRPIGRPLALQAGTAGVTASIVAVSIWALLLRGHSSLVRRASLLWAVALSAVPAILSWNVIWSLQFDGALDEWPTSPVFRCLALTLGIA